MALKATIYKANLDIADMDRGYYANHSLTIACHPSETAHRLTVRILAFALFASDRLIFCKGISTDDEPDIWERDLTDHVNLWVELGTPEENRIRKGCNRADRVVIVAYGDKAAPVWWDKNKNKLQRFDNLQVISLADDEVAELVNLISRTMDIQVSIQDGEMWVTINGSVSSVKPQTWR